MSRLRDRRGATTADPEALADLGAPGAEAQGNSEQPADAPHVVKLAEPPCDTAASCWILCRWTMPGWSGLLQTSRPSTSPARRTAPTPSCSPRRTDSGKNGIAPRVRPARTFGGRAPGRERRNVGDQGGMRDRSDPGSGLPFAQREPESGGHLAVTTP